MLISAAFYGFAVEVSDRRSVFRFLSCLIYFKVARSHGPNVKNIFYFKKQRITEVEETGWRHSPSASRLSLSLSLSG